MNNIKTNLQKGFTLIELMIVIAIIGILLAIAIPAYSDYTIRSRTTECVNNLAPLKTGVSEFYLSSAPNHYPGAMASIGSAKNTNMCSPAVLTTATGVLNITSTATTGAASPFTTITMTPTVDASKSSVQWKCTSGGQSKYAPASCR